MTTTSIIPVILSGGSGTRLWPLSRQLRPKQFLPMIDELTLFQNTLQRLQAIPQLEKALVICNEEHRFMVAEQLRTLHLQHQGILLEPIGRNTAPAIALAALYLSQQGKTDALLLVLPADHVIQDKLALQAAIHMAAQAAHDGYLATFGIVPQRAETGYGYIQQGASIEGLSAKRVAAFVEKPDAATANAYFESGEYLWNSGMFLFRVDRLLDELALYQPEVLQQCQLALAHPTSQDLDFIRLDSNAFASCPSISIDYALMEKTKDAVVVPLDAGWNDVGAWSAVWEVSTQDEHHNVLRGDVLTHNASNNLVYAEHRLVTLVGVENLTVVETKDAVLVAQRDQVQDVKHIVTQLQHQQRPEASIHREVNRPWGTYDCIDGGERFQVKRIMVKPGAKLSLQMHHHRAEHWIVVSGTAEVRCGDKTLLLTENQSTYIPLGEIHSLSNPGKLPLEIIEVQSGSYLGEDDIVRFEDVYGRHH